MGISSKKKVFVNYSSNKAVFALQPTIHRADARIVYYARVVMKKEKQN
jgi:hypothetical protein